MNADSVAAYNQGREDEKTVLLMWFRYWMPSTASEFIGAIELNQHRGGPHLPKDVTLRIDGSIAAE